MFGFVTLVGWFIWISVVCFGFVWFVCFVSCWVDGFYFCFLLLGLLEF